MEEGQAERLGDRAPIGRRGVSDSGAGRSPALSPPAFPSPPWVRVCVRCYAGQEGGDRGRGDSAYCPSRRGAVRKSGCDAADTRSFGFSGDLAPAPRGAASAEPEKRQGAFASPALPPRPDTRLPPALAARTRGLGPAGRRPRRRPPPASALPAPVPPPQGRARPGRRGRAPRV
uniref:Uncharacterized protein n=1 Tax=Rangifer tarandus platyrhynchus TaxID=3082113 RepID=A0ACB0F499_RANTA|nr:unnamed protein product [Rangifer tarandus platyrhynchus]